jgi:hypothetical protein
MIKKQELRHKGQEIRDKKEVVKKNFIQLFQTYIFS